MQSAGSISTSKAAREIHYMIFRSEGLEQFSESLREEIFGQEFVVYLVVEPDEIESRFRSNNLPTLNTLSMLVIE